MGSNFVRWAIRFVRDWTIQKALVALAGALGLTALGWDTVNAAPRGVGAILGLSAIGISVIAGVLRLPTVPGQNAGAARGKREHVSKQLADMVRRGDDILADIYAVRPEELRSRQRDEARRLEVHRMVEAWHRDVIECVRVNIAEHKAVSVEVVALPIGPDGRKLRLERPGELPEDTLPYYLELFVRELLSNLRRLCEQLDA